MCVAGAVVVGPHNSRAEPVGLGYHGRVRHPNPFPLNSYAIVPILRVPIDILHADTVGKSAAQSVSAGEAVEPLLRAELANRPSSRAYEWLGTTTVTHNAVNATASLYIVVTTTSSAVART